MFGFIFAFLMGVMCVAIGISNMKGNISMLHSYHRKRVAEEDRIPFGRTIGIGMIIIGISIIIQSGLSIANLYTGNNVFLLIGTIVLVVGLLAGLGITFYAMIKYNKGIF